MTAASIINYRVAPNSEKKRPTSHPKLTVQKNLDNNQQAMFKPMYERQKMQMFPMRTKSITTSNLNHYNQMHPTAQTINHKRFNALSLRSDSGEEQGLPKSHILTAKTISRKQNHDNAAHRPTISRVRDGRVRDIDSHSLADTGDSGVEPSCNRQSVILNYGARSLHPHLNTYGSTNTLFGKAELVDYSSIAAADYHS